MIDRFLPFPNVLHVLHELKSKGIENSWLVGGAVRDSLLGREPADVDIVCDEAGADTLISKVGGTVVGKPPFFTVSVSVAGRPVEIALLTGASIQKDLGRRDFTINAIAADADGNIIDPFGGVGDIQNRVLRLVSPEAPGQAGQISAPPYETDPVRVVRLLRFACTLNFTIEPQTKEKTKKFILEHRAELENIPKERYGKEFLKGFASRPYDFLTMLENYSLLAAVLPEIEAMRGVEQPVIYHPEGDVLEHTFHVLAEAQRLIQNFETRPGGQDITLALAALFHDAGKPVTLRPHPKYGHNSFFGHEEEGARIVADALGAWAVPGGLASDVAALVKYHMVPGGDFTERTCVKIIRRYAKHSGAAEPGDAFIDRLFDLALCDARGTLRAGENILAARKLFYEVRNNLIRAEEHHSKRLLDGKDVMAILGLPPGPEIGQILEELDIAVGSGTLPGKDEAVKWLKDRRTAPRTLIHRNHLSES